MVTLKNPTDALVKMVYLGKEYSLAPMDSDTFDDDAAAFWLDIHQFLEVVAPASEAPKAKEFSVKTPEKEEEKTILEKTVAEEEVKETKAEDFEIKPVKKVISKK